MSRRSINYELHFFVAANLGSVHKKQWFVTGYPNDHVLFSGTGFPVLFPEERAEEAARVADLANEQCPYMLFQVGKILFPVKET